MKYEEKMPIYFRKTARGFAVGEFRDWYDNGCSIQKSSHASRNCIWLGIDGPEPKILASQAAQYGVETSETTGWVPFPIPDEVSIVTRMHLSRDQVASLLPLLQHFVTHGELPTSNRSTAEMLSCPVDAVGMASRFHEAYERLAPTYGYQTREDTRDFNPESPNGRLMVAVCTELMQTHPAPDRVAELEAQLAESREREGMMREGRMREDVGEAMRLIDAGFDSLAYGVLVAALAAEKE